MGYGARMGEQELNMFGRPIRIADGDELRDLDPASAVYVIIPINDANPTMGSAALRARRVKTLCDSCKIPCWLDPESVRDVNPQVRRICLRCADELLTGQAAQVPQ